MPTWAGNWPKPRPGSVLPRTRRWTQIQSVAAEVAQAAVQRLAGLELARADVDAAVDQVLREAA